MATTIDWDNLGWTENDDFIAFAFGDFNSSNYKIVRTSDSGRYEEKLSPPMNDKTAEVPGADGQYYFGTTYRPRVFDVSFAFEDLTKDDIRNLKQVFSGKEMRELCFAESCTYGSNKITDARVYMAKVTGQPNIKALCFDSVDDEGNPIEVYKGEGSIQFTAYWPFARGKDKKSFWLPHKETTMKEKTVERTILGDVPTFLEVYGYQTMPLGVGADVLKISDANTSLEASLSNNKNNGTDAANYFWDTKTGLVTYNSAILPQSSSQTSGRVLGATDFTYIGKTTTAHFAKVEYYEWYY